MKLKEYTTTGLKALKGMVTVSFNNHGGIFFNGQAKTALGLKPGDKIVFLQDEENPSDWYLKVDDEKGAELRENTTGHGLACNFVVVAHEIITSTGNTGGAKFQLSTDKENDMHAIITRRNLRGQKK